MICRLCQGEKWYWRAGAWFLGVPHQVTVRPIPCPDCANARPPGDATIERQAEEELKALWQDIGGEAG